MTKVSSNAGKHPYLRTNEEEFRNLFSHLKFDHGGVPIAEIKNPFFNVEIESEYVDKNNEIIHFKDTVKFQKKEYYIDFRDKKWIMVSVTDPKKIEILRENAHLTVLSKKYN